MMVLYVPYTVHGPNVFHMKPFDGCFAKREGSMCNWVVPGTWPEWML